MVWKIYGKAQLLWSLGRFVRCIFLQNVHARKLGEISVFYAVPVQQAAYQIRKPTTSFCNQSALKKTITPEDFKIHLLLLDMSEVL